MLAEGDDFLINHNNPHQRVHLASTLWTLAEGTRHFFVEEIKLVRTLS